MPKVWNIQSNFSQGELDPKLIGRQDLSVYYNGLSKARNVVNQVQGGVSWRPGTKLIDANDVEVIRIFAFQFSTDVSYLLAFADERIYIYKNGTELQTNINGSGNDYLSASVYAASRIPDIDFIQSADTVIITSPDFAPRKITREDDTTWSDDLIALTNIPQYDFDDASSPTPVDNIQTIAFTNENTSDRFKLSLDGILTEEIVFGNSQSSNANAIENALLDLPNTGNSGVSVSASAIDSYVVTFSGDSANDWDVMSGTAINVQTSTFEISVIENQAGVSRKEDTWALFRGYPSVCTFHEGRLWFANSRQRPQTLWGSVVGDFFNFNLGKARDGDAVEVTLDTDQQNAIQGILSNRALQIFTTGQEFFVPQSPITPENIAVIPQTNFGAKRIRPINIDGRTLYVQRTGKAIREFVQAPDVSNIYNSNSITLLASHLVIDPVKMTASRGSEEVDANYAYFVNSDGTILVYNSLGAEGITGFTLWSIDDDDFVFSDVTVVDDSLFILVSRGTSTYIVQANSDFVTDLAVQKATPVDGVFDGLDHLEGKTVNIIGDGAFEGTAVVSGGEVTVDTDKTETEVGLNFTPLITTMPLNIQLQNGPNFAEPKKINRVAVDFFESLGIIVSNSSGYTARIADKTMAVDVFDNPTPKSGREDLWLLGWDKVATVSITRDTPVNATILTIGVEVGV